MRMLIVEDEKALLDSLEQFFKARGFEVYTAATVKDAVFIIDNNKPHIFLADILLEHEDSMLAIMQAMSAGIEVIVITGYAGPTEVFKLNSFGVKNIIRKPIDVVELGKVVDEVKKKIPRG